MGAVVEADLEGLAFEVEGALFEEFGVAEDEFFEVVVEFVEALEVVEAHGFECEDEVVHVWVVGGGEGVGLQLLLFGGGGFVVEEAVFDHIVEAFLDVVGELVYFFGTDYF